MHVRIHSDHFPPSNMMLIFHQPIIVPYLPNKYQPNIVDILDLTISTNYGLLLFAQLMLFVVDIDKSSNIFGENYKYNLSIVVNCPKQRNTGKEKK